MNAVHDLRTQRPPSREETLLRLMLLAVGLVLLGPPVVFGIVWGAGRWDDLWGWRPRVLWGVAAVVGLGLYAVSWPRIIEAYSAGSWDDAVSAWPMLSGWLVGWSYAVLLLPLGSLIFVFFRRLGDWLKEPTLQEQLAAEERKQAAREGRQGQRAAGETGRAPAVPARWLRLGPLIKDGRFERGQGIDRVGSWLAIEEGLLDTHLFVVGSTGAGKSETLKRLASEVLENTDRDLYLVDGKGDPELAQDFRGLAWKHGRGEAPVFRLGTGEPGARYDGFRGAKEDVYSRLVEMVGASTPKGQTEGPDEYYKAINRNLLQLMCYPDSEGPPRSFEEVRARLDLKWIEHAWQHDVAELAELRGYKTRDLDGLRNRLLPLVREFAPLIGPDGFALEETRAAVFSLRTQSAGDTASRLLKFIVEDLKDFAGKRQTRPALFIIDEFTAFGSTGILSLLSLARHARLGIVLATQDVVGLGNETEQRLILANTRTKLLMATDFPEEVASLAGTIQRIESSIQHDEGQATGMGSGRIQDAFRISMNEVPALHAGEAYLIRARRAAKLRVAEIGSVPAAPPERYAVREPVDSKPVHTLVPEEPPAPPPVTSDVAQTHDTPEDDDEIIGF